MHGMTEIFSNDRIKIARSSFVVCHIYDVFVPFHNPMLNSNLPRNIITKIPISDPSCDNSCVSQWNKKLHNTKIFNIKCMMWQKFSHINKWKLQGHCLFYATFMMNLCRSIDWCWILFTTKNQHKNTNLWPL